MLIPRNTYVLICRIPGQPRKPIVAAPVTEQMEKMVFFLTEVGLIHYSVVIKNNPTKLADTTVYTARCTLNKTPWTETLKHHRECAKILVNFHTCSSETKQKAVYRKYMNPEKGAVALFPSVKSLVAEIVGETL